MDNYKYSPLFNYMNYIKDFDDELKYEMCVFFDHFGRDVASGCINALSITKEKEQTLNRIKYLENFTQGLIEKINEFNDYGYFNFPKIDIVESVFFKKINSYINNFYYEYNTPQKKFNFTVHKGGK